MSKKLLAVLVLFGLVLAGLALVPSDLANKPAEDWAKMYWDKNVVSCGGSTYEVDRNHMRAAFGYENGWQVLQLEGFRHNDVERPIKEDDRHACETDEAGNSQCIDRRVATSVGAKRYRVFDPRRGGWSPWRENLSGIDEDQFRISEELFRRGGKAYVFNRGLLSEFPKTTLNCEVIEAIPK